MHRSVSHWQPSLCSGRRRPLRLCQDHDLLGWADDCRLYPKPLFRAQRVTHLYLRGSGVRQFGNRFDQLLDECGVQDVVDPNFGHGLLPLTPQQVRAQGAVDNLIC